MTLDLNRKRPARRAADAARPASRIVAGILLVSLFASWAGAAKAEASGPVRAMVSVLPQAWLVESIGGAAVTVTVMVPPGASPATYEPTPGQMRELSESDVYFTIGVPFERAWLPRFRSAVPGLKTLNMAVRVKHRAIEAHHHPEGEDHDHDHDHDEEHDHDHDRDADHAEAHDHAHGSMPDPHVWVSPAAMRLMASTVLHALVHARPDEAAAFRRNYAATVAEIGAADADAAAVLAETDSRAFMVVHPAWGYFADDYGLRQIPIEVAGGEPSPRELRKTIDIGRAEGVTAVFVQRQFSRRAARAIAGNLGAEVRTLNPLDRDWPAMIRATAEALAAAARDRTGTR